MNRKFSIALAVVGVLVLGAVATDANAACNPSQPFSTVFGPGDEFSWIAFPADADTQIGGPNLRGRFWQAGNRTAANETGCPDAAYMYNGPNPGEIGVFGELGAGFDPLPTCDNAGCPTDGSSLILLVQTRSTDGARSYFAVGKVAQVNGRFDFWSIEPNVNWAVLGSPRARVTTSSRQPPNVTVNIHLDAPTTYAHSPAGVPKEGIITGYQVFRATGNADPGRNPATGGWTLVQTITTSATGADLNGLVIDCSNTASDVFLGTRAIFDGGQFTQDDISEATRIECNPGVAEPRFKQIEKKRPTSPRTPPARQ